MGVHRPATPAVRDEAGGGIRLDVVVTPGAARTEVRGTDPWRHGIVIKVAAKPTEGAANAELLRFLARRLGIPASAIRIVAGHRSRRKTVVVHGVTRERIESDLGLGGR